MFRASQWHGATQMQLPPRPCKSAHRRGFESRFESAKRAFRTRLPPVSKTSVSFETSSKSHAFRSRPPPKVTCQVSKPSVSYETSSKAHMSKSAKAAFRKRLPPSEGKRPSHRSTHFTQPCQAVSRFQPLQKQHLLTSHANPNVTATFTLYHNHNLTIPCACHETFRVHTSNAHKVLRLPRNVTSVTPRNPTIPCACHENRTSTPQKPHKVLRLPRKVTMTISYHVSFHKICTTTHVWNDFDPF